MACLLDASDPTPCAVQDGLIAISDTGECVRCGASVACKLRDFVKAENKQKMPENVQTGWRAASADSLPDRHEWVIVSGKDRWSLRPFVCEARVAVVEGQILGITRGQYFAVIVDHWMPMPNAAVAAGSVAVAETRDGRQAGVASWCAAAFGSGHASSIPQRGIRLAEEAIEAAQAAGCEAEMVRRLVDHVFARPPGSIAQELGGVGVTVLALAHAAGLSADSEESREYQRVLAKPLAHFKARNEAKNAAGFNVADTGVQESPQAESKSLIRKVFNRMIDAPNRMCWFSGEKSKPCELCGKSWMSPDHQAPMFDPMTPR